MGNRPSRGRVQYSNDHGWHERQLRHAAPLPRRTGPSNRRDAARYNERRPNGYGKGHRRNGGGFPRYHEGR
jgi:hypothetical protein